MPDLIIEVKGGVVTAVYTNLDVTVSVNDHDEGVVEGPVVVLSRNTADNRGGRLGNVQAARAEGVLDGLQEAAFICEGVQAEMAEGQERQAESAAAGEC